MLSQAMSELALPRLFAAHRRVVWSLCYRMTGSAADADDLVQETFLRALERPPADAARDPRPWLVRVAVNLSRDHLRARQRRGYTGPFLASPIETSHLPADDAQRPDSYYGALESLSFAFLAALEALTPRQRAVLILCDVMGYAVRETAAALEISEANVKTTHHRARAAMADYDAVRQPITRDLQARTMRRMRAFLIHALHSDPRELAKLLAADVTEWNDGAGEFFAAQKPIRGIEKVILFTRKTQRSGAFRAALRQLNGLPALVIDFGHASELRSRPGVTASEDPKIPRRSVVSLQLDTTGAIHDIYGVVASRKLTHIGFERLHAGPLFVGRLAAGCFEPELAASLMRVLSRKFRAAVSVRENPPPFMTDTSSR